MVGWGCIGEFVGNAAASFVARKEQNDKAKVNILKADEAINNYKQIENTLNRNCQPIDDHVTRQGLNQLCSALKKNDNFGAQLAIDSNPGLRKRDVCIIVLKGVSLYLSTQDPSSMVRAATYNLIGCK